MTAGPFSSELIHDPQFEQLVESICSHPQMFVHPATFGSVCAYLCGFDHARSRGPLLGLREWLVVRLGEWNNLSWPALAQRQLAPHPDDAGLTDEERATRALGRLLAEFFAYRRANGLTKVFYDYARWLLRRRWYTGPLRPGQGDEA